MKKTTILLLIGVVMTSAIGFAQGSTNTSQTSDQTPTTIPPTSFLTAIGVSPAAIQTAQNFVSLAPSEQTMVTNAQFTNLMGRIESAQSIWSLIDTANTKNNTELHITNNPTNPTEEEYLGGNVSGYTEYTQALNALPPKTQGIITNLLNSPFPFAVLQIATTYNNLSKEAQQYALSNPAALSNPPLPGSPGYAAWTSLGSDAQKSLQSIGVFGKLQTGNLSTATIDKNLQTLNINTPLATKPETVARIVTSSQTAASQAPPTGKVTMMFDETGSHIHSSTPRFEK